MLFRSSDVLSGVGWYLGTAFCSWGAEGVLRWRVRYEADRGREGREPPDASEGRRLASGEEVVEEAGDRWDGGV
jgi:hypothetical protein